MDDRPFESMNMIPFIDIMLVLLTIVLVTSTFIASGRLPVNLPRATTSELAQRKEEVIDLDAAGIIHYGGRAVSAEQLKLRLKALAPDTPFLLRADRAVRLQHFIDVADALKQLGFTRVAVQTEHGVT